MKSSHLTRNENDNEFVDVFAGIPCCFPRNAFSPHFSLVHKPETEQCSKGKLEEFPEILLRKFC